MPNKDYLNDYDPTAGNNTDVGGVNIAEGCAPSVINDAIRELMSHLAGLNAELDVGADVSSAATLPINIAGMMHDVTGTTTITAFAEATNDTSRVKILQFDGVLTLTHHSTDLVLLTGANRTTAAGDIGIYYQYAAGDWREVYFSNTSSDLVNDTTPQLGGDLDLNGNNIDFPTTANISDCLDEDTMSSDSATALATQQSIKAYVDSQSGSLPSPDFTSTDQTVTADATLDVAHGLGSVPTLWRVILKCTTTEHGYAVNDEIEISPVMNNTADGGATWYADGTNISIITGAFIYVINQSTKNAANITVGNWKWVVRAWS